MNGWQRAQRRMLFLGILLGFVAGWTLACATLSMIGAPL